MKSTAASFLQSYTLNPDIVSHDGTRAQGWHLIPGATGCHDPGKVIKLTHRCPRRRFSAILRSPSRNDNNDNGSLLGARKALSDDTHYPSATYSLFLRARHCFFHRGKKRLPETDESKNNGDQMNEGRQADMLQGDNGW